jgi:hypothetical protein
MPKGKQQRDQPKPDPNEKAGPASQADQDVRRGDSNRDTDVDIDVEDLEASDLTPSSFEADDED